MMNKFYWGNWDEEFCAVQRHLADKLFINNINIQMLLRFFLKFSAPFIGSNSKFFMISSFFLFSHFYPTKQQPTLARKKC